MINEESWASGRIDVQSPNAARMYDYYLGGSHHFAADREAAERALGVTPVMAPGARANRAFLQRVVRFCLDEGIRQFLDLGSGIPTVGHVHEIAHRVDPAARVAYVDNEPVAIQHTANILSGVENATVTDADLCEPEQVLRAPGVADFLDFGRPVAVLMVAVLHFIPDKRQPDELLQAYRRAVPGGSMLATSHITDHYDTPDRVAEIDRLYSSTTNAAIHRRRDEYAALLGNEDTWVEPGLSYVTDWRPDSSDVAADAHTAFWGCVERIG